MFKFAAAAGLAIGALTVPALAADLIVDQGPANYDPSPVTSGLYLQLLGGATLPGTFDGYDIPSSWAIAGVVGVGTGIDGLSVEADGFYSQAEYDGRYTLTTGALMAALKYTATLSDTFSVYGAVGLGGVYLRDEDSDGSSVYSEGWGAGYLLKAGVTAAVADNVALVGEVRYTDSFAPIADVEMGPAAVLAGIHIGC
ncbi:MAG: outer membrane protein [Devosia sp.]